MAHKQVIRLTEDEHRELLAIVRAGVRKAHDILHANILLKSAAGWTDEAIADAFSTSRDTVGRVRLRACGEGVLAAIEERPRPGSPGKLSDAQEALVIALACSAPPNGRVRWTAQLLAEEAIKREFVKDLSTETVRQVLQKTRSSRGRWRVGATPQ